MSVEGQLGMWMTAAIAMGAVAAVECVVIVRICRAMEADRAEHAARVDDLLDRIQAPTVHEYQSVRERRDRVEKIPDPSEEPGDDFEVERRSPEELDVIRAAERVSRAGTNRLLGRAL